MSKDEMQPISLKYAHQLEQVGEKLFWICIYFGKRYSVAQLIFNICFRKRKFFLQVR